MEGGNNLSNAFLAFHMNMEVYTKEKMDLLLEDKVPFFRLNESDIDNQNAGRDKGFIRIGIGIFGNTQYFGIYTDWICYQQKVAVTGVYYRVKYGENAWQSWTRI